MGSKLIYETMDRTFRKIRKNDSPFGGVTMVFSGDWRQCKYLFIMIQTYLNKLQGVTAKSRNLYYIAM